MISDVERRVADPFQSRRLLRVGVSAARSASAAIRKSLRWTRVLLQGRQKVYARLIPRVAMAHRGAAICISIFLIHAAFDQQKGTQNLLPKRERNITEATGLRM